MAIFDLDSKGYLLTLADGQKMQFAGTKGTQKWLKNFALTLGLSSTTIDRKYYYPSEWELSRWEDFIIGTHRCYPELFFELEQEEGFNQELVCMWRALALIYQQVIPSGGMPIHAALIEKNGKAILLVAKGGGGKSTCFRRVPVPWQGVCDDEVLIVKDNNQDYWCHPFPTWKDHFSKGAFWNCKVERKLPLSAVLFIEKAERDEVLPVEKSLAAKMVIRGALDVYEAVMWGSKPDEYHFRKTCFEIKRYIKIREQLISNSLDIVKVLPTFWLQASLTGNFWNSIESAVPGFN